MTWWFVVPSLKISGGNREALRLGEEMQEQGAPTRMLCLWQTPNPMSTTLAVDHLSTHTANRSRAAFQFAGFFGRFRSWWRRSAGTAGIVFTHYTTIPLSLLIPRRHRYFHVQDLEWKFVGNPLASRFLRTMILFCYRQGTLISANSFLSAALRELGLPVAFEMPVWADARFAGPTPVARDVDFVMVLRKGAHKRFDLYRAFIARARDAGGLKLAVISPDEDLVAEVRSQVDIALVSPSLEQMRELYARSRCFVHLSDHEGFGLPPLEAMAAGCVPLCRDSGGVRAFMSSDVLRPLLLSPQIGVGEIFDVGRSVLANAAQMAVLSGEAQRVFREGLEAASRLRNERIGRLLASAPAPRARVAQA